LIRPTLRRSHGVNNHRIESVIITRKCAGLGADLSSLIQSDTGLPISALAAISMRRAPRSAPNAT
jgi:hypothetical protein